MTLAEWPRVPWTFIVSYPVVLAAIHWLARRVSREHLSQTGQLFRGVVMALVAVIVVKLLLDWTV